MAKESKEAAVKEEPKKKCGIVMPIAGFGSYSKAHWEAVERIITDVAKENNFESFLVSYADETNVIHRTIINNLYSNELVVVDVSGKNPNVMFELDIRLAFDKPTIIIKDDKTNYIFDTGVIDHLVYPSELDYYAIIEFKDHLSKKIESTYTKSKEVNYRSFLKNFGQFTISHLDNKEVTESEFIIRELHEIKSDLQVMRYGKSESNLVIDQFLISKWKSYLAATNLDIGTEYSKFHFKMFTDWLKRSLTSTQIELMGKVDHARLTSLLDS